MKCAFSLALSLILLSSAAQAHTYWIRPNQFYFVPEEGHAHETPRVTFDITGSDSYFNAEVNREAEQPGSYEFRMTDPDGAEVVPDIFVEQPTRTVGEADMKAPGTYLLHWIRKADKPMYSSLLKDEAKTYLRKPKDELTHEESANLAQARAIYQYVKTYVSSEKTTDNFSQKLGDRLEIVPLKHPNLLAVGDHLPVQVFYEGKPLVKGEVITLYDGYRHKEENDSAWKGLTDSDGKVSVPFDRPGLWLVEIALNVPAADPKKADEDRFKSMLLVRVEEKGYPFP